MNFFADISKFTKISDYLPILNGSIFADILILLILYYTPFFNSKYLKKWYETYRLSAVIADVFILVIGMIITRFVYYYIFNVFNPIHFLLLLVVIQIIHDILFYLFFINVPRGINKMLDLFKDYSSEVSAKAIAGDSFMIIIAGLASMIFANYNNNINIISLIIMIYLIPYILYTK
jgi:uncharacterized protein YacL